MLGSIQRDERWSPRRKHLVLRMRFKVLTQLCGWQKIRFRLRPGGWETTGDNTKQNWSCRLSIRVWYGQRRGHTSNGCGRYVCTIKKQREGERRPTTRKWQPSLVAILPPRSLTCQLILCKGLKNTGLFLWMMLFLIKTSLPQVRGFCSTMTAIRWRDRSWKIHCKE